MEDYVEQIGERSVEIIAQSRSNTKVIQELGGASMMKPDLWRIDYDTEDQLAKILQRLRDADFAFAGGCSGWPPSAVADRLRERGKFHGPIKEIVWSGPGQAEIRQA